jgi:hypothetical protein
VITTAGRDLQLTGVGTAVAAGVSDFLTTTATTGATRGTAPYSMNDVHAILDGLHAQVLAVAQARAVVNFSASLSAGPTSSGARSGVRAVTAGGQGWVAAPYDADAPGYAEGYGDWDGLGGWDWPHPGCEDWLGREDGTLVAYDEDHSRWTGHVSAVQFDPMGPCWTSTCKELVHERQFTHKCNGTCWTFRPGTFICGNCGQANHPDNTLCFNSRSGCRGRWETRVANPDFSPTGAASLNAQYAADLRASRLALSSPAGKGLSRGKGGGGKGFGKGLAGNGKGFGGKGGDGRRS